MRATLFAALLVAACIAQPSHSQVVGTRTDLELLGRVIGPLPVEPGRPSRFLLTARNLGPNPVSFAYISSWWPYDASGLNLVPQNGPRCYAYRNIDSDPPIYYGLIVVINVPLGPGESAACEFELTATGPLALDATITFEGYADGNLNPVDDPNFSNNRVTFPLGQAPVASIPSTTTAGLFVLALTLCIIAWRRSRLRALMRAPR